MRPISVNFEIPYYTASGLQVRYLKIVEKSGYQALPWVRYITRNGDYQLRGIDNFSVHLNSKILDWLHYTETTSSILSHIPPTFVKSQLAPPFHSHNKQLH